MGSSSTRCKNQRRMPKLPSPQPPRNTSSMTLAHFSKSRGGSKGPQTQRVECVDEAFRSASCPRSHGHVQNILALLVLGSHSIERTTLLYCWRQCLRLPRAELPHVDQGQGQIGLHTGKWGGGGCEGSQTTNSLPRPSEHPLVNPKRDKPTDTVLVSV